MLPLQTEDNVKPVDPEEQPFRNLLSAIIFQAIYDANRPFQETKSSPDLAVSTSTALNFLFVTGGLDMYCSWLGYDAQRIRTALLSSGRFKHLQARYKKWQSRMQEVTSLVHSDLSVPLIKTKRSGKLKNLKHKEKCVDVQKATSTTAT